MVLYRTKIGLRLMDKLAKRCTRFLNYFSMLGVYVAFLGMFLIFVVIVVGIYKFLFMGAPPPFAPLFPGVKIPGLPVLSFFHWIIAIFILACVHEFNHGLVSRVYDVKLKSSGFAVFSFLLPLIPAAFVEPDEEQLKNSKNKVQLSILAAGSYANFITGAIFLLLVSFLFLPWTSAMTDKNSLIIDEIKDGSVADLSGLKVGDEVVSINSIKVSELDELKENIEGLKPGDGIELQTKNKLYYLNVGEHPKDKSKGYIGIVDFKKKIKEESIDKYGNGLISFIFWLELLLYWVFVANIGVGLFNLLPMGPLDGGRMFYVLALFYLKDEKKARKLLVAVSLLCLLLILIGLSPFIIKLINFIFAPLLAVV